MSDGIDLPWSAADVAKAIRETLLCYSLRGRDFPLPDLDSRTGFRDREWQKCWRLIKPDRKRGAKL
jgi:hypothetical protein